MSGQDKPDERAFPDWDVEMLELGTPRKSIRPGQVDLIVYDNQKFLFNCGCGQKTEGDLRREDVATSYVTCPQGDTRIPLAVAAAGGPKVYRCTRNTA